MSQPTRIPTLFECPAPRSQPLNEENGVCPVEVPTKKTAVASVLLADHDRLSVELLSSALKRCQGCFRVVGHCVNSTDAIGKLDELKPTIALISVNLEDGETAGYRVLSHLREHHPKSAVIALQNHAHQDEVLEAFRCGARGVISRDKTFRLLVKCIRKVQEGGIWASPDQIDLVFGALKKDVPAFLRRSVPVALPELTPREKEVVALVVEGFRNAQIGARLSLSEHTVRNYVMKIYDKLGVSNRVQLTRQWADVFERESVALGSDI